MKGFFEKKLNNRGETIVEVMVAFIILLIVLALFGTSITATGNAEKASWGRNRRCDIGSKEEHRRTGKEPYCYAIYH